MVAVAVLVVLLGACSSSAGPKTDDTLPVATVSPSEPAQVFYAAPTPLPHAPPGNLIRTQTVPNQSGEPAGTVTYRILYHSTSVDGADVAESGLVIVPGGSEPPGGYPIISWAHGTTGVGQPCAPSISGQLSLPDVGRYLSDGFVVAAADYEGEGVAGAPSYLAGLSEGRSVVDAARAARQLVGSAADGTVVIYGHSQGGHAALFAGEVAPSYAHELHVAGVVSVAPVSSLTTMMPPTPPPTTLTTQVYPLMAVISWSEIYPSVDLADVLTEKGAGLETTVLQGCAFGASAAVENVPADQLFLSTWTSSADMSAALDANTPGNAPTAAPLLVVQGDADDIIPPASTTALVDQQLCRAQHDTVEYDTYPGHKHSSVLYAASDDILSWIKDRIAGVPATSTCGHAPVVH